MPDYYGATLAITGVPAFAVTVEQAEGEGGLRWERAEIDFDAIHAELAEDLREGLANEPPALRWEALRQALDQVGDPTRADDLEPGGQRRDRNLAFFACDDR